jgi:hypothetical protein
MRALLHITARLPEMLPRGATAYKKYTPLALANPAIARGLVEGFCYVRFHAILVAPRTDWLWPISVCRGE